MIPVEIENAIACYSETRGRMSQDAMEHEVRTFLDAGTALRVAIKAALDAVIAEKERAVAALVAIRDYRAEDPIDEWSEAAAFDATKKIAREAVEAALKEAK